MVDPAGEQIRAPARPLRTPADLDPLLERIGDARIVAIGEASHGTHEDYAWRAALTRRLIEERGLRPDWLGPRLDHRAIGVVYRPERERWGNYVPTVLGKRYDAFLHLEDTTPLQPLHLERAGEHVPVAAFDA